MSAFADDPAGTRVASVAEFVRAAPIDLEDPILELAPEAYLESHVPSAAELSARLDGQVRENVGALVAFDLTAGPSGTTSIIDAARDARPAAGGPAIDTMPPFESVAIGSLFDLHRGDYHSLADEDAGAVPVCSCADFGNGIVGSFDVPEEHRYRDGLTIAFNGSPRTTKIHPYTFGAKDDVAVAMPKSTVDLPVEALIFIQAQINAERWRFSYYRKCFRSKLGRQTVKLPMRHGEPDVEFMTAAVRAQPYWWFLSPRFSSWLPTWPPEPPKTEKPAKAVRAKRRRKTEGGEAADATLLEVMP